jgi:hypothetical protein
MGSFAMGSGDHAAIGDLVALLGPLHNALALIPEVLIQWVAIAGTRKIDAVALRACGLQPVALHAG